MSKRVLLFGLLVALCSVPVWAADVEVRFFDEGNLVVGATLTTFSDAGGNKLAPTADGIYLIVADPGTKVTFQVHGTNPYTPVTVAIPDNLAGVMDIDVVAQQANDLCADATAIGLGLTAGSTLGASADGTAFCGTSNTGPGVWYSVMGTGNTMTASTCNDGNPATGSAFYDSKITVFCMGCDTLTCVGGNDDGIGCAAFSSRLSWCSQPDTEYLVLVHGFLSSAGSFELAIADDGVACGGAVDCQPPPPVGACCNCLPVPFNCTRGTLDECDALGGEFQGTDSACFLIDWESFPDLPIPDGTGAFVSDTISVTDSGIINDVNVAVQIAGTWIGDLIIEVEHDSVTSGLWNRNCDASPGFGPFNGTFDDEGALQFCSDVTNDAPVWDNRLPVVGTGGPLSTFDGQDRVGDWTLSVSDNFGADVHTLSYWALEFNDIGGTPLCVDGGGNGDEQHITICHYPPGNPGNARTITVGAPAVDAHVAQHGDTIGACEGGDLDVNQVETVGQSNDEAASAFGSR